MPSVRPAETLRDAQAQPRSLGQDPAAGGRAQAPAHAWPLWCRGLWGPVATSEWSLSWGDSKPGVDLSSGFLRVGSAAHSPARAVQAVCLRVSLPVGPFPFLPSINAGWG